jgi:hypothetical protein
VGSSIEVGVAFRVSHNGRQDMFVGVMNLRALQEMMNGQTLEYIFPFSRFAFQTDVAFLILSEGKKSTFFQVHSTFPVLLHALTSSTDDYKYAAPINQHWRALQLGSKGTTALHGDVGDVPGFGGWCKDRKRYCWRERGRGLLN